MTIKPGSTGTPREDQRRAERSVLVRGDLVIDLGRREVSLCGGAVRLTPLEFRLLHILVEVPGRVWSRDDLLARLHALDGRTPVDRTIDNLVVRLRRKLGDPARYPVFIEAVWGIGYRFVDRPASAAVIGERAAAAAFEHLPAPAMVLDPGRRIVLINAAGRQLWGLDAGAPVQAHCFDVVGCHTHRAASLKATCPALEALRRGTPVEARYLAKSPDGADLPLHATYTPLALEGELASCLLLVRPAAREPVRRKA